MTGEEKRSKWEILRLKMRLNEQGMQYVFPLRLGHAPFEMTETTLTPTDSRGRTDGGSVETGSDHYTP